MKLLLWISFSISMISCSSQNKYLTQKMIKNDDDLLSSVFMVFAFKSDSNFPLEKATSYFFYSNINQKLYLITCSHVIVKGAEEVGVQLLYRKDSIRDTTRKVVPFLISLKSRKIFNNDDLSIIDISDLEDTLDSYYFKCFSDESMPTDKDVNEVSFTDNFLCIGFPYLYRDGYNFFPIVIHTTFASLPKYNFFGKPEIAINASVRVGNSGGPVVQKKGGKYYLYGTVRAIKVDLERIYERDINKFPTEPLNTSAIDSLNLNGQKITAVVKDFYDISYVIKSSVISKLLTAK